MIPKLSVVVPVYNALPYLERCLESLHAQTLQEMEVILVDDGSTDGSGILCNRYIECDSRFRIIHKEVNGGLVHARRDGIREAHGEWVGFVDADDWVEPQMFEWMYGATELGHVDAVLCGRVEEGDGLSRPVRQGFPAGRYDRGRLEREVFPRMVAGDEFFEWGIFPGYWDKVFRRDGLLPLLEEANAGLSMGEDAVVVYPYLLGAGSLLIMNECPYHYRQNSQSMSHAMPLDVGRERASFRLLAEAGGRALGRTGRDFGLERQWRDYLLFLMVPRADALYEEIEGLDFLFPFPGVARGSRVVIYGMGAWGIRLYGFLRRSGFCEVAAVSDRRWEALRAEGYPAIAPERIWDYMPESIVVACSFAGARRSAVEELGRMHPELKVSVMDVELVKGPETLQAFGLLRMRG